MVPDTDGGLLDRDDRSVRDYRNAVERHWDPADIDLAADTAALKAADSAVLEGIRIPLAEFGVGELAVTEDLARVACVLESPGNQLFLTTSRTKRPNTPTSWSTTGGR